MLTPENQEAPWLLFEAGALAKNLDRSKVCPLLFGGLEPTDVKGPLVQFQAAQFSRVEMKRVMKMINAELSESALAPDVLDSVFEMWWPKLEEQIVGELEIADETEGEARRSERDLLEEVLALTRRSVRERERGVREMDHPAWDDLLMSVAELARTARSRSPDDETSRAIARVLRPLEYLSRRAMHGHPKHRSSRRVLHVLSELEDLLATDFTAKSSPEASDTPDI